MKRFCILTVCCCISMLNLEAFNLRKAAPDLKGSVVNSIYQNHLGIMWVGTNAGISRYDGKTTALFTSFRGTTNIHGTRGGKIITGTIYGLKIYDEMDDSIAAFAALDNVAFSASDSKGTVFSVQGNGSVYYKMDWQANFSEIKIPGLVSDRIRLFSIDANDVLHIMTVDGVLSSFGILQSDDVIHLNERSTIKTGSGIQLCFDGDNRFYMVDDEYKLHEFSLITNKYSFIADLRFGLANKGRLMTGVVFRNEFYFGTDTGLYVVKGDNSVKTVLRTGITCLTKDKFQDLIWIGTSGDGLYTYSYDLYTIKSNLLSHFAPSVSSSITAIYLDSSNTLWLGTEANGMMRIPNYNSGNEIVGVDMISTRNGLPDNMVYSLQKSKHGIWIGCKSGLVFYSDRYKTFSKIYDIQHKYIRSVYEQDSVLWITSYEGGIVKANVVYSNGMPKLHNIRSYVLNDGYKASNRFSEICANKDDILFVNNGHGIFKIVDNEFVKFSADKFNSINHLVAIGESDYIGTADFGTLKFGINHEVVVGDTLLNSMGAKDVVVGYSNDYWLSTDNGLAIYNAELNTFRCFDDLFGLEVSEYISGSSFKDEQSGVLFFGGINGFSTIEYNTYGDAMDYMPPLYPEQLSLFGIDKFLGDFGDKDSKGLLFESDENFFAVTFNALDYINGNNYVYYYKIDDGQWINNGNSATIYFTNVTSGNYVLSVKYYNKIHEKASHIQTLSITVLPPWYRSIYAYGIYLLLVLFAIFLVIYLIRKRRQRLREEELMRMKQQRKEDIYEAKLDFFTDIAHEFTTPLTLIHGPCNRILEQKNITPLVSRYVSIIDRNARRMNALIRDLMSFKQIEAGHKQPEIKRLNVSEIADSVIDVFKIDASGTKIDIEKCYYAGMNWNSDESFLITILTNLLSNAVKYSKEGTIKVEILIENEILKISVSNGGKGIAKEDLDAVFNRYTALSSSERREKWQKNGLGLAIVSGMIKLLKGTVDVESIPNRITTFTISLPNIEESEMKSDDRSFNDLIAINVQLPTRRYVQKEDWQTVTVIDDDAEMLWFICDVLNEEFNVIPINDPMKAINIISKSHTDIILCDVMMEGIDGIALAKTLKSNKETLHIPLIIVSAIHEVEKQTEAIDAGAEMYVTKPFNSGYLKTTIRRLLGRKEDLKDYFASPLSAFELSLGKLQHSEHKRFLKKVCGIINKNIQNEDLSSNMIAAELGISIRSLYRKLKEITDVGLLDMIHEAKLVTAENLLLKSKFTTDEIVFKSGFTNRAGFYRAFSKKFGCTPTEFKEKNGV